MLTLADNEGGGVGEMLALASKERWLSGTPIFCGHVLLTAPCQINISHEDWTNIVHIYVPVAVSLRAARTLLKK